MVVFIDGEPAKEYYRKFKIHISGIPNDTAMHNELMRRRVKHKEWQYPDLMLIDGGRGQLNSARAALGIEGYKRKFTIAGLAKRQNLLYLETQKDPIPMSTFPQATRNLLTYVRDESHRFAISYHRKLHRKQFRNEKSKR
jgi:excinuclease ABC subunit C